MTTTQKVTRTKFIVSSKLFQRALSTVGGIVSPNPIVPILEDVLLDIDNGVMRLTGTDLQTTITDSIPVEASESIRICAPYKMLADLLSGMAEQPLTITISETFGITIKTDSGRYTLAGEDPEIFPKIPPISNDFTVGLSSATLLDAFSSTLFAVLSNKEHLVDKPQMGGLSVKLQNAQLSVAATDGHRIVRYRINEVASEESISVVLPKNAVVLASKLLKKDPTVSLDFGTTNLRFRMGKTSLSCRLIDERFPDYENAIPGHNPIEWTLNRAELIASLNRLRLLSNSVTRLIGLEGLGEGKLKITATDLDFSNEGEEEMKAEVSAPLRIGFNANLLSEGLANLKGELVTLELSAINRAMLLKGDNDSITSLVMPSWLPEHREFAQ